MNTIFLMFLGLGLALLVNYWYIVLTREKMPRQQKLWLGLVNHVVAGGAIYWAYVTYVLAG